MTKHSRIALLTIGHRRAYDGRLVVQAWGPLDMGPEMGPFIGINVEGADGPGVRHVKLAKMRPGMYRLLHGDDAVDREQVEQAVRELGYRDLVWAVERLDDFGTYEEASSGGGGVDEWPLMRCMLTVTPSHRQQLAIADMQETSAAFERAQQAAAEAFERYRTALGPVIYGATPMACPACRRPFGQVVGVVVNNQSVPVRMALEDMLDMLSSHPAGFVFVSCGGCRQVLKIGPEGITVEPEPPDDVTQRLVAGLVALSGRPAREAT